MNFDPTDSSLFLDVKRREETFARLRECESPTLHSDGDVPIYSLVRYADVERAYKEPEVFSPSAGLTLDSFDPSARATPSRMLETAPPGLHQELKGAMQGAFRGSALAAVRAEVEERLERFLDGHGEEPVEFVGAFARDAATAMMSRLLGVSPAQAERLSPALEAIGRLDFGSAPGSVLQRQTTELRLLRELTRAVDSQRAEGRAEGLIGALLGATVEDEPLGAGEVALNCFNVAVAGTGASQHTLAAAAAVWADHPEAVLNAGEDPKLVRRLVEETLRWLTPVIHLTRVLTAEAEICGQRLPEGAGICLWNIAANRDEAVFADAASFDPNRPTARNLAFGAGPQYCLGAEVVRMQLEAFLAALNARGLRIELAAQPTWMRSNAIAGVESLLLRIGR